MERLTFLNGDDFWCVSNDNCFEEQSEHYCGPAIDRLAAYEDTGLTPEICANYRAFEDEAVSKNVTFKRIVELMDADAEGRLLVLPCKPGEYWRDEDGERVLIGTVSFCKTRNSVGTTDMVTYRYKDEEDDFAVNWIYFKSHFTRDEAEAALKGEGKEDVKGGEKQ